MEKEAHRAVVTGNVLSNFFLTFSMALINSIKHGEQLKLKSVFAWNLRRRCLALPGRWFGDWVWGWGGRQWGIPAKAYKNSMVVCYWACFKLFCKRKRKHFNRSWLIVSLAVPMISSIHFSGLKKKKMF